MSTHSYHNIMITPTQRRTLWMVRFVLLCLLVTILITLFMRFLYPTYHFNFLARIDSLANTISRPFVTHDGTAFDIAATGDFTTAQITLTLAPDTPPLTNTQITARHAYAAFLSPISTEKYTAHESHILTCDAQNYLITDASTPPQKLISDTAAHSYFFASRIDQAQATQLCAELQKNEMSQIGFRSGTLISSPEGIFVTNGDAKHPFQDELVFQSLGYNFDNVLSTNSEERGFHKKARMMTMDSAHPFGTIFFARDADRTYIYDQDQLHKISPHAEAQRHAIIVDERSRDTVSACTLRKKLFHPRTYTCSMPIDAITHFPGNIFRFTINATSVDIATSHIALKTAPTHQSLRTRITLLKKELSSYYAKNSQ